MSDKQLLQRAWDALAIWKETYPEGWDEDDERLLDDLITRLAQPQREWQGLTDEEMFSLWMNCPAETEDRFAFAHALQAKLKEKNT